MHWVRLTQLVLQTYTRVVRSVVLRTLSLSMTTGANIVLALVVTITFTVETKA